MSTAGEAERGYGNSQVWSVDSAVDKNGAVDVGVMHGGVNGRLVQRRQHVKPGKRTSSAGHTSNGTSWSSMLPMNVIRAP
jgi:hypothetical protein